MKSGWGWGEKWTGLRLEGDGAEVSEDAERNKRAYKEVRGMRGTNKGAAEEEVRV